MNAQSEWPATKIEMWPLAKIVPYDKNPREHSSAQIDLIASSMRDDGVTSPILVDENGIIIYGHGRRLGALKNGFDKYPVVIARGWTEEKKRAVRIKDNSYALLASWSPELLRIELNDLQLSGYDMPLLGFDNVQLVQFMADVGSAGLTDPDEAPEPPANPVSIRGDLWALGRHRLMCGDSTNPQHIERLMDGAQADLCFTSPPYAQQRDYGAARALVQDWDGLMQGVFGNAPMAPAGQILVNLGLVHRDGEWLPYWDGWIEWMRGQGWRRFGWYAWDQGFGLPGDWNGRLAPSHEFVFHFNKKSVRPAKFLECTEENLRREASDKKQAASGSRPKGMRGKDGIVNDRSSLERNSHKIPDSVIRVNRHMANDIARKGHPATFSVGFAKTFIQPWPGLTYEPFLGSGSTIMAAEVAMGQCYGIEIDPAYCDIAVIRWQNFTGQTATMDGDGRTFAQISDERLNANPKPKRSAKAK